MSKIMRVAVLAVSLVSLFSVLSSAAGATTWTNQTDTSFTATSGGNIWSVGAVSVNCTGAASTVTGSAPMSTPGASPVIASGTMTFPSCRFPGGQHSTVDCAYGLTPASVSGHVLSGFIDVTCSVYQLNREDCHFQGTTVETYTNPETGLRGLLALHHSSTLRLFDGSGGRCPLGTNVAMTLTPLNFTVTSAAGGPTFTRD
jgi:hypothetical protein